ncbi:MAG: 4-hydroxybenzoate octaprenyltransferase [Rickettsiales bacterium]|nr:4-hydroxybenzoate octaprenyltransferase [Rickettsiales bacterium]|tara:strand:- start:745 stop:1614 length:870 start_codon:yes stop_codon:yes gene_type:complete
MFRKLKKKINILLVLGRYNYPTGAFLLMWPCFWGVLYNPNFTGDYISTLFLLFIGSFVMRGAGCCINDFFDKDLDKKIERTKNRPLAKNLISDSDVLFFILFQLVLGFFVLINFNAKVIFFSFLIFPMVIIYPLFKRVTYFPQLILGLIFNWGVLIGFLTQNNQLNLGIIFLYLSGIFLTIAYDTIYAFQDLSDDKLAGVKSLAIYLEKKPRVIIFLIFCISFIFLNLSILEKKQLSFFETIILTLAVLICYLIQYLNFKKKMSYKSIFDFSAYVGALITVVIFLQNYL